MFEVFYNNNILSMIMTNSTINIAAALYTDHMQLISPKKQPCIVIIILLWQEDKVTGIIKLISSTPGLSM